MKSRNLWIGLTLLIGIVLSAAPNAASMPAGAGTGSFLTSATPAALALAALNQDAPKASVDINITKSDRGGEWYKNPILIGAGVIILVLLVALASRGGSGTTVVKS
jgi:hypothetical protein